jgi:GNAT superfamily N-acetyltransferase
MCMTDPVPVEIVPVAFDSEDAAVLVSAAVRELRGRYGPFGAPPPDAADFVEPRGIFLLAQVAGEPVACGGIRYLEEGVAEIRRMYTVPAARGRGLAYAVLGELERYAVRFGYRAIRLETGWLQPEAIAVYGRAGYTRIPAYGEFSDEDSICMEKVL